MTGGSYRDKDMKLLTYDEAKNIKTFNPICSMRIFKEHVHFRSFIYFNFRMIVIDTDMAKQIWYEKVNEKEEFTLLLNALYIASENNDKKQVFALMIGLDYFTKVNKRARNAYLSLEECFANN